MLNLLPPEVKQSRRTTSLLYTTIVVYILIMAAVALGIGGLFAWTFVQQGEMSDKQAQIQQLTTQRNAKKELVTAASFIEDRLKSASSLQESRQWEKILADIAAATPTDTKLTGTRLAIQKDNPQIIELTLGGQTTDRRSIVLFRDKLEASEAISKTTILSLSESQADGGRIFTFSLSASYTFEPEGKVE